MKKNLINLSVILVILPVSFGGFGKFACNNQKSKSGKETEVKQKDSESNDDESKLNEKQNCTFRLT